MDWYGAKDYCENTLTRRGSLAAIEDKVTQDFLAKEAIHNWDGIWINGYGSIDAWHSGKKCSIIKISKYNKIMEQIRYKAKFVKGLQIKALHKFDDTAYIL